MYFARFAVAKNFHPNPVESFSGCRICRPDAGQRKAEDCWLPIDSKFPLEDFARLQDALENGDRAAAQASRDALKSRI